MSLTLLESIFEDAHPRDGLTTAKGESVLSGGRCIIPPASSVGRSSAARVVQVTGPVKLLHLTSANAVERRTKASVREERMFGKGCRSTAFGLSEPQCGRPPASSSLLGDSAEGGSNAHREEEKRRPAGNPRAVFPLRRYSPSIRSVTRVDEAEAGVRVFLSPSQSCTAHSVDRRTSPRAGRVDHLAYQGSSKAPCGGGRSEKRQGVQGADSIALFAPSLPQEEVDTLCDVEVPSRSCHALVLRW